MARQVLQMARQVLQRRRVAFLFSNRQPGPVQLRVEPWAIELMVPANRLARVEFEGPDDVVVEVRSEPSSLTVYGWEGSIIANPLPQLLDPAKPT
jgi:hypothetical protein